jgi:hypothetical protein
MPKKLTLKRARTKALQREGSAAASKQASPARHVRPRSGAHRHSNLQRPKEPHALAPAAVNSGHENTPMPDAPLRALAE